nr:EOG090X047B [Eulimnadia texana]
MFRKKLVLYTGLAGTAALAAYGQNEIHDSLVGAIRFGRAAVTVSQIAFDYNRTLYTSKLNPESTAYENERSKVHLRSAEKLLELCRANGGAFIKVGQHLGALDYLLPPEYVRTMRVLHSQAPSSPFSDVLSVIREDLQKEPTEVFTSIDPVPLGTASLAQVHKATLMDGNTVAVKVQHPLVKTYSNVDMKCMEILARAVAWFFPDFKLMWLVEETKRNLPCELDFTMEGKNAEQAAKLLQHLDWLHVPKVHWDLTTSRVLTMEFCDGLEVGSLAQTTDPVLASKKTEVAKRITQLFAEMIFENGYVHCDPHPGNVKVQLDERGSLVLHLLDHGLYTKLSTEFRETYAKLWMSIIRSNVDDIQHYAGKLGVGELFGLFACMLTARSWNAILSGIDKNQISANEEQEIKNDASKYLIEITEVLHRVPREMLLIFKTNDLLRGLDYMLGVKSSASTFVTMSRSCAKATLHRQLEQCSSNWCRIRAKFSYYISQLRITAYQIYLWWTTVSHHSRTITAS